MFAVDWRWCAHLDSEAVEVDSACDVHTKERQSLFHLNGEVKTRFQKKQDSDRHTNTEHDTRSGRDDWRHLTVRAEKGFLLHTE